MLSQTYRWPMASSDLQVGKILRLHDNNYIISIVEEGATTIGIHFTDTKEDSNLELVDVYPLGKVLHTQ